MIRVLAGLFAGLACAGASAQVLGLGVGVGMGAGGSVSISVPLPQAAQNAARARAARTGALEQPSPLAAPPIAPEPGASETMVLQPGGAAQQASGAGPDPIARQAGEQANTPAGLAGR